MAHGQDRQVVDVIGGEGGDGPGQGGAPVVTHDMGPAGAQFGEDRQDVPGQQRNGIGVHGLGLVRAAVAAQVGHDNLEPGLGQRRNLMPPEPPGVGEPVQQHDRASRTVDLVLDTDSVDLHPAHAPSFSPGLGSRVRAPRHHTVLRRVTAGPRALQA